MIRAFCCLTQPVSVPTIFVFTKYDMLTTAVEADLLERGEDYTQADVETKAKQTVEEQCVEPIKTLTEETSIPYIAVSSESDAVPSVAPNNHLSQRNIAASLAD